jgi:putative RecB family exonuclease
MPTVVEPPARAPALPRPCAPNVLAERITGRTYLSHTQISMMQACPRKFAFQYVEKAQRDFLPSSLLFGGAIHAAMEVHYRARLEGTEVTRDMLFGAYQEAWTRIRREAGENIPVRFKKGKDEVAVHALGARILATFLSSPLANPKGTILAVEEPMRVVLSDDLPDLLAVIDLVTQTDGALHIVDFKTSRSRWKEEKAQELSGQLLLYGAMVKMISTSLGVPVKLHFAVLTKAKKPVVQLLPVAHEPQRIAALTASICQVWEAIQVGNFYPSPSPMHCTICPFKSRCPVFAGY